MSNRITQEQLKSLSEWLDNEGKAELNKVSCHDSETESYIKQMSKIDEDQLRVPYSL